MHEIRLTLFIGLIDNLRYVRSYFYFIKKETNLKKPSTLRVQIFAEHLFS